MSVFKRGNIFYTDFVINGQRVCKSTGKTTKREAKHFEAVERQKLLSGTKDQKASKLLLQDAIEQVYDQCNVPTCAIDLDLTFPAHLQVVF